MADSSALILPRAPTLAALKVLPSRPSILSGLGGKQQKPPVKVPPIHQSDPTTTVVLVSPFQQQPAPKAPLASSTTPSPSNQATKQVSKTSAKPAHQPSHRPLMGAATGVRLNKFVRRLHDMLQQEKDSGIVEWRRGLLVLHSTDAFSKSILPKYFNTHNFKTFRRQLNYYGFVHVRSFSTTGTATTALWVNRDLAQLPTGADIQSVLLLRRVEPCETAKTSEGRRVRKELAIHTVEADLGVSSSSSSDRTLPLEKMRSIVRGSSESLLLGNRKNDKKNNHHQQPPTLIPSEIRLFPRRQSRCGSLTSSTSSVAVVSTSSETGSAGSCSSDEESAANLLLQLARRRC